jgi:hypothetical protein
MKLEHVYNQPNFGENWFTYPNLYSRFVQEIPDGSKIVEVGCWKGKSIAYLAVEIINSGKKIKVDAVDTWLGSGNKEYYHGNTHDDTNALYELFLSNILLVDPEKNIITPIRKASTDAVVTYADESLDVVFIDACHTYECVKEDIAAWFPKVKKGGYIAGHDYLWSHEDAVRRAVNESLPTVDQTEGCWVYKKPI